MSQDGTNALDFAKKAFVLLLILVKVEGSALVFGFADFSGRRGISFLIDQPDSASDCAAAGAEMITASAIAVRQRRKHVIGSTPR